MPSSIAVLSAWFREHVDKPYPSKAELVALQQLAGVDAIQCSNWFTNTRKRFWRKHPTDPKLNELSDTRVAPPEPKRSKAASSYKGKRSSNKK